MNTFIASFLVFSILNFIENLIHYNIGRTKDRNTYKIDFNIPTEFDWIKIIGIMILFGILQATFTCVLSGCRSY